MGGLSGVAQLLNHILQLFAQKDRNNSWRGLIRAQAVIISYIRGRLPKQVCVKIHSLDNAGQNQKELHIFVRRIAGIQHISAVVSSQGPVVVLSGTVHSRKGLFVKEAGHTVISGHPF